MFARNLRNPRAADPELDKKSLASLGITFTSCVWQEPETTPAKTSPKLPYALDRQCTFRDAPLNAAKGVKLLSSDHVFSLREEVDDVNGVQRFNGNRRLSLKTVRD
jgi:hypothetical protein